MISMQDIADRLGVSKSTVSLVLSGKAGSRVSEEMKKKVLKEAKELNYHVNDVARSLRTGASKLISVIVTDISNEFFGRLTFHIQEKAKKAGYLVLTINSNESLQEFEDISRALISKKVDGVIAVPTPGGDEAISYILSQGVPVVAVDRMCSGVNVDYVGVDNYSAAKDAMEGLVADGMRRIAMVGLDLDIPPLNARRKAYEDVMETHGLSEFTDVRLVPFDSEEDSGIDSVVDDLKGFDAVFFTSRRVFTQAMSCLSGGGADGNDSFPCLLCFDDVKPYMTSRYDIRYVEQPVEEMAAKAFELLMRKIQGDSSTDSYIFPTRCVAGKS